MGQSVTLVYTMTMCSWDHHPYKALLKDHHTTSHQIHQIHQNPKDEILTRLPSLPPPHAQSRCITTSARMGLLISTLRRSSSHFTTGYDGFHAVGSRVCVVNDGLPHRTSLLIRSVVSPVSPPLFVPPLPPITRTIPLHYSTIYPPLVHPPSPTSHDQPWCPRHPIRGNPKAYFAQFGLAGVMTGIRHMWATSRLLSSRGAGQL